MPETCSYANDWVSNCRGSGKFTAEAIQFCVPDGLVTESRINVEMILAGRRIRPVAAH